MEATFTCVILNLVQSPDLDDSFSDLASPVVGLTFRVVVNDTVLVKPFLFF